MTLVLHHHPQTRAANVVWMLEEVGAPYELRFVDFKAGEQKRPEILALNPMGKLPILVDDGTVVTEAAAIALYLGDRYGYGTLAPRVDEPARGAYLRWSFFGPSVIEPGSLANAAKWEYRAGQAGWGTPEAMLATIESAIGAGPFLIGERFTMADIVFGGTVRWMINFGMLEKRAAFTAYVERLDARPAWKRASEKNAAVRAEHGLG
jgi:glutathione S-transferase